MSRLGSANLLSSLLLLSFNNSGFYTSKEMNPQNVAVVTGSSSGIGYETSLMLARHGFRTFATMRNLDNSEILRSIAAKGNLPIHIIQ